MGYDSDIADEGKKTCRLCAEDQEVTVTLYSQQSNEMLLHEKLSKYLQIELEKNDNLPKNVCIPCCTKLHEFCTFVEEVRQAQLYLFRNHVAKYLRKKIERKSAPQESPVDQTAGVNHVATVKVDFTDVATLKVITDDKEQVNIQKEVPKNKLLYRKLFSCEICKRGFITDIALKGHIWAHKLRRIKVKGKKDKKAKESAPSHVLMNQILRCHLCSRRFRTQRTYNDHMTMHVCDEKNTYNCKVCGRAYKRGACLKSHMVIHSDVRAHACTMCPKKFKRKLELQVHINYHTGYRPYKCQHCDRTFASASNCHTHRLRDHPTEVSPKSNKQKVKEEIEPEPSEFVEVKMNDKGPLKYQCEHCANSYSSRENYMSHMFQHTGKKMFPCTFCPAEFITKKGLILHGHKQHPYKKKSKTC